MQSINRPGSWPWSSPEENALADKKYRYTLTSLSNPRRCIGFARRRMGRGGRVILDRLSSDHDNFWKALGFTIYEMKHNVTNKNTVKDNTSTTNSFTNLSVDNSVNHKNLFNIQTDCKTDVRTNLSEIVSESDCANREIKEEHLQIQELEKKPTNIVHSQAEQDEMVDFLSSVRRNW